MGPGVLLSIAMGAGFGGGNGSGRRRSIVCPCDIGIGMGLSIRRNFGMIAFMGSIDVDGNGWDGGSGERKMWALEGNLHDAVFLNPERSLRRFQSFFSQKLMKDVGQWSDSRLKFPSEVQGI
jgi:hypothetical protein